MPIDPRSATAVEIAGAVRGGGLVETHLDQFGHRKTLGHEVEDAVGFGVGDAEVGLVGLAFDEVGGGGLVDDLVGDA